MKGDLGYYRYQGEKKCPRCNVPVYGYPALSRVDNLKYICSNCGAEEAIKQFMLYAFSNDYKPNKKQD